MSKLDKAWILKQVRESNCIESPILIRYFTSVWVGEEVKQRIEKAKKKLNK